MAYHLTENGPKPCRASKRACPVGGAHFSELKEATLRYQASLAESADEFNELKKDAGYMELPCAFGTMRVKDGDLSDIKARTALISGLCGSLAVAIQEQSGEPGYFVCYGDVDEESLERAYEEGNFHSYVTHALVGSGKSSEDYVDAFGRKTAEELREFYGDDVRIVRGTPAMLRSYAEEGVPEILRSFARSALRMDSKGESYSYFDFPEEN